MPFLDGSTFALPQSFERGTVCAFAFTRGTSPLGAGDGTAVETVAVLVGCGFGLTTSFGADALQYFSRDLHSSFGKACRKAL